MSQLSTHGVTRPVAVRIILTAAVAVLMLASCGKAPADAAPDLSSTSPAATSFPVQTTADVSTGTSVPATPQPSEASAAETELSASTTPVPSAETEPSESTTPVSSAETEPSADPSVAPSLYIPSVTYHPIATPSPTLSIPSASLLAMPESDSILGTWVNGSESLTFFSDYTYEYIMATDDEVSLDIFGTYSHNRVTDKYVMDLMGNRWVLTIEDDTLTADNGHHISTFQRQQ